LPASPSRRTFFSHLAAAAGTFYLLPGKVFAAVPGVNYLDVSDDLEATES